MAVTAAVAGVGVSVQPAAADATAMPAQRIPFNDGRQCIGVDAYQSHGLPVNSTSVYVRTMSTWASNCFFHAHNQHPGNIRHRGQIYRNGTSCVIGLWDSNPVNNWMLEWHTNENYGSRCGAGHITHDTWHMTWNPYIGNWNGPRCGCPFPVTYHNY